MDLPTIREIPKACHMTGEITGLMTNDPNITVPVAMIMTSRVMKVAESK
jgi:hypothetical protein